MNRDTRACFDWMMADDDRLAEAVRSCAEHRIDAAAGESMQRSLAPRAEGFDPQRVTWHELAGVVRASMRKSGVAV
jgi:hypothetical protein